MGNKEIEKCEFCGQVKRCYQNSIDKLVGTYSYACDRCKEQNEIIKMLEEYHSDIRRLYLNNPLYMKNFHPPEEQGLIREIKENERHFSFIGEENIHVKKFRKILELVNKAFIDIGAYIFILDDFHSPSMDSIRKSGNFIYYTHHAIMAYLIIKLKELNHSDNPMSLNNILKFIEKNKKALFDDFQTIETRNFKDSGDKIEFIYPRFNIEKLKKLIEGYKKVNDEKLLHLKELRDISCHLPVCDSGIKLDSMSYNQVKEIYESLLLFFYSISVAQNCPISLKLARIDYNIGLDYINDMLEFGIKKCREN